MTLARLAQIEPREMKAEGIDLPHQAANECFRARPVRVKALFDLFEIGEEIALRGIAVHVSRLACSLETLLDESELLPVGLSVISDLDAPSELGKPGPIPLESAREGRTRRTVLLRLAQARAQFLDHVEVLRHHQSSMAPERFPRHLRGHVGIPVAIPADPRAEPNGHETPGKIEARYTCRLPLELLEEVRDGLEEHDVEVVEGVRHLVQHRGLDTAELLGQPDRLDFALERPQELPFRQAREILSVELGQEVRDAAVFFEKAPANRLGGMRGDDGLEPQGGDDAAKLVGRCAGVTREEIRERARLRSRARLESVVAAAADAVVLFGDVRELEICGKGSNDADGLVQIQASQKGEDLPLPSGIPPGAKRLGKIADPLFDLEQRFAPVPLHRRSEKLTQAPDVVTKRLILVRHGDYYTMIGLDSCPAPRDGASASPS